MCRHCRQYTLVSRGSSAATGWSLSPPPPCSLFTSLPHTSALAGAGQWWGGQRGPWMLLFVIAPEVATSTHKDYVIFPGASAGPHCQTCLHLHHSILLISTIIALCIRDMLIWQIEEYLYPTSILGMIYHIRANAFIFFGQWCSQKRAIQPICGVKLNNSIHLDWITCKLHKLS